MFQPLHSSFIHILEYIANLLNFDKVPAFHIYGRHSLYSINNIVLFVMVTTLVDFQSPSIDASFAVGIDQAFHSGVWPAYLSLTGELQARAHLMSS